MVLAVQKADKIKIKTKYFIQSETSIQILLTSDWLEANFLKRGNIRIHGILDSGENITLNNNDNIEGNGTLLEIFIIQVDEIFLPDVALDRFLLLLVGFLCLNPPPFLIRLRIKKLKN